jgi:Ca2+-transporting ATPase
MENRTMNAPPPEGLSTDEAASLLAKHGPNELPGSRPRRLVIIARDVLAEPMLLLLIAAATVYVMLGEAREAIAISASMLVVIAISIAQERRTERALVKLRELSSPRALVVRDGGELRVAGREVVPGDILVLREGDRVAADARLLTSTALSVDESIITGESLPIDKSPSTSKDTLDGDRHCVFSGSLVTHGFGVGQVIATGSSSQIGRIGKALDTLKSEPTPLFREVRRIVKWAAIAGLALCAVVAIVYAMTRHDWLGGVLAGITLAMGLLPEEFPVVLTIFLALGAWRLSRHQVLTRRMPAIETIGALTVLAVDKTGTRTENRMRVAMIETDLGGCDLRRNDQLDATAARVLATALGASEVKAFDPMERAIHEAAHERIPDEAVALKTASLVREYDLTPQLLAVTHVWQRTAGALDITVKGAPETVFRLCRLPTAELQARLERVSQIAADGLRVLAVAHGRYTDGALPETPYSFDLAYLGLLCLADPIRADVPAALAECASAGIRVVMITGDHPGTALAIARQAGFRKVERAITGAELQALDDRTLCEQANSIDIYARMTPEHKLRLVQSLKANGEIVAMTGDGVNDAPALKAAHVGVAMGGRGTDVAREAASIVLLNDDFTTLVRAVRWGRRVYDNLRHAMAFIVAVHIPIAGMGLLPVLMGWPLLLLPLHVLFMEFVIDPACSFVFEADEEESNIMQRKPRDAHAPLFSAGMLRRSAIMGGLIFAVVATTYALALSQLAGPAARTISFGALVVANIALIFVNRAPNASLVELLLRPNRMFWWIAAAAIGALVVIAYVPPLALTFQFGTPPLPFAAAAAIGSGITVLIAGLVLGKSQAAVDSVKTVS